MASPKLPSPNPKIIGIQAAEDELMNAVCAVTEAHRKQLRRALKTPGLSPVDQVPLKMALLNVNDFAERIIREAAVLGRTIERVLGDVK